MNATPAARPIPAWQLACFFLWIGFGGVTGGWFVPAGRPASAMAQLRAMALEQWIFNSLVAMTICVAAGLVWWAANDLAKGGHLTPAGRLLALAALALLACGGALVLHVLMDWTTNWHAVEVGVLEQEPFPQSFFWVKFHFVMAVAAFIAFMGAAARRILKAISPQPQQVVR